MPEFNDGGLIKNEMGTEVAPIIDGGFVLRSSDPIFEKTPERQRSRRCHYCDEGPLLPHGSVKECARCGSIVGVPGPGLEEENGVVDGVTALHLPSEIKAGMFFTGEFRGNRAKQHCPEKPLLTVSAIAISAMKAGLKIEKVSKGILILDKE